MSAFHPTHRSLVACIFLTAAGCELRGRLETPMATPTAPATGRAPQGTGPSNPQGTSPSRPQGDTANSTTLPAENPPEGVVPETASTTTLTPTPTPTPTPDGAAAAALARQRSDCEAKPGHQFRGGRCVSPEEMAQAVCEEQVDTEWVSGSCRKLTPARTLADFLGDWKASNVTVYTGNSTTQAEIVRVRMESEQGSPGFRVEIVASSTFGVFVTSKLSQKLEGLETSANGDVLQRCRTLSGQATTAVVGTLAERRLAIHSKYLSLLGGPCQLQPAAAGAFLEMRGGLDGAMSLKASSDNGDRLIAKISR